MIAYATLHKYDIFIYGIVQTKHIRQRCYVICKRPRENE